MGLRQCGVDKRASDRLRNSRSRAIKADAGMQQDRAIIFDASGSLEFFAGINDSDGAINRPGIGLRTKGTRMIDASTEGEQSEVASEAEVDHRS